ncbi:MAG: ABC transporter substrate-binding protein [Cellvibrionaceae bacterium]
MRKVLLQVCFLAVFWLFSSVSVSAETVDSSLASSVGNKTAHQVIDEVTVKLMGDLQKNSEAYKADPTKFLPQVESLMDSVVDFPGITRGVMGKRFYGKATPEQRERFMQVFKRSLLSTYAKGLVSYSDEKVVMLPPEGDSNGKKRVSVGQEIHGATDVYPVSYTMVLNGDGQWKLLNMVINGVNLGKTFRNQFTQSMRRNAGDIDKVIETWDVNASEGV